MLCLCVMTRRTRASSSTPEKRCQRLIARGAEEIRDDDRDHVVEVEVVFVLKTLFFALLSTLNGKGKERKNRIGMFRSSIWHHRMSQGRCDPFRRMLCSSRPKKKKKNFDRPRKRNLLLLLSIQGRKHPTTETDPSSSHLH